MAATALSMNLQATSTEPNRFTRLVDEHLPALSRRARWLTGDHDLAQDLVQECLIRAWRSLHGLRSDAAARSWLYCILQREYLRSLSRLSARVEEPLTEHHLKTLPGGKGCQGVEAGHDLRLIVTALPDSLREPLLLSVVHGHSNAAIGRRLRLSENAVGLRLFRARRRASELAEV